MTFVGHIISAEGIKPEFSNIQAVNVIKAPKNKADVLRILGLVKFFSKNIPNLSSLTSNLRY